MSKWALRLVDYGAPTGGVPEVCLYLIKTDGPAESGVMYGRTNPAVAAELAEAFGDLGLTVERVDKTEQAAAVEAAIAANEKKRKAKVKGAA